jgi:hypothetical protein
MSARENQQMGCYLRSEKAAQESSPLQDRRGALGDPDVTSAYLGIGKSAEDFSFSKGSQS